MGWVTSRHGALYGEEYGFDLQFEALVAEIVANFIKRFNARRERCWIAEIKQQAGGLGIGCQAVRLHRPITAIAG